MSRIVCSVFRSWFLCPIVFTLAFSLVIYGSMIVSHHANPAIRFLGLELLGIPIFGVVGGLAVAMGFNLSRAAIRPEFNTIVSRIPSAAFAGLALGLNGIVAGWILMLPVLAVWNSYDTTVPLFLHAEDRDRAIQWSNLGAFVSAVIAFVVGCALHVLDSAQNKENG